VALKVEIDEAEAGFVPGRLDRVTALMRRYVDDGLLPGWTFVLSRDGQVVQLESYGQRDMEAGEPIEPDTIFRVYSMSKPITSVAAMMLWEEGAFELKDPVRRFIPSFADTRVWRSGSATNPVTQPLTEELAVWHLLTHTSGLTYGFMGAHPVDDLYRRGGFEWGSPPGADLAGVCDHLAAFPLLFQPGTEWNYSHSTDVLGRVVEVASGMPLDRFFAERIFGPLGMVDSGFYAPADQHHRVAALYGPDPKTKKAFRLDAMAQRAFSAPEYFSGGGGVVSTAPDYQRFVQMLARGGELDGVRLLGSRTVRYMASNHLPGGADLTAFGRQLFSETTFDGVGFGLGVSVTLDPVAAKVPGSVGDFGWGGAASTTFWVDRVEDMTGLFLTQLLPSSTHPIRSQLKQLVHQALA
jgi:CubicO group peptidase (beta-lactamase class C family)